MIRNSIYTVHVEFYAGTWINHAISDLVDFANTTGHRVTATFNDQTLTATPGESDDAVLARYAEATSAR